jgi:hypothetical protein
MTAGPLTAQRVAELLDRLRTCPDENLDADDARTAGMVALHRWRRRQASR